MLDDYRQLVESFTRSPEEEVRPEQIDGAIELAVIRYSTDRPRRRIEAVARDEGLMMAMPASWEDGFSDLVSLTPADDPLDRVRASILNTIDGDRIYIEDGQGLAEAHATFTIRHVLTDAEDTIPQKDREAVANYASAVVCEQLATYYSGALSSTIQSDSVDHGSKGREFSQRAGRFRKLYQDHLGIDPKRNSAAGVVVDLDGSDSRGRDRLIQRGRYR